MRDHAILAGALAACSRGDGGTTGPADPTPNGTWRGSVILGPPTGVVVMNGSWSASR